MDSSFKIRLPVLHLVFSVTLTFFILPWSTGCKGAGEDQPEGPFVPSAKSLLTIAPFIGDETEIRDPVPETTRVVLDKRSIEGWLAPEEKKLRFPVNLEEYGRLSFLLGVSGDVSSVQNELQLLIEFVTDNDSRTIYNGTRRIGPGSDRGWIPVDLPLNDCPPGNGELHFIVDGLLTEDPDVQILWGAPSIYYPVQRTRRNILLIGVDTLRLDAVSVYGGRDDLTPNLERFAESATVFTQARSQSPWTLSSFASMVTGGLPSRIGATMLSWQLPDRATTIAEMLLNSGFATGTVCSNTYLGNSSSGFHQGVEDFWYEYNVSAEVSIEKALGFINRVKDRDWFCFLHFQDPHTPFEPSGQYVNELCDPGYDGPYQTSFHDDGDWKFSRVVPLEDDIRQVRNLYDGEVAYLDESLQRLFMYLEENNLMDDTLIIFAADHGEEFYEHGAFEHGQSQYDELVHIPLIIKGDGFPEGEVIDQCVGNTDIVPTILNFLDMPLLSENLPGEPLQHVVDGSITEDRLIFGEDTIRGNQRKYALQWPYKCILDLITGESELFDLAQDPGEIQNIGDRYPEIVGNLNRAIIESMLPEVNSFHVWFLGTGTSESNRFTGSFHIPDGIDNVHAFGLSGDDEYSIEGDTVIFSITNAAPEVAVDKHFTITPVSGGDLMEVTIRVDGEIDPDSFYPYGTLDPEPSGFATVRLSDFPLAANIPVGDQALSGACYIWGVRGFSYETERIEMDPESEEQLRALGYIH